MAHSKSAKILLCVLLFSLFAIVLTACNIVNGGVTWSYTNADRYTVASEGEVSSVVGLNLEIDWINGAVSVRSDEEAQSIQFKEIADGEALSAATTMHYFLDGNTLRIKYAQSGRTRLGRLKKYLNIIVPANFSFADIEVDSISGDVILDELTAREVEVDCISGNISINCDAVSVEADTTSGNISIAGNVTKAEIDTISGSVAVIAEPILYDLEVDTTSGDVNLLLNPDNGFRLEFDTNTGVLANAFKADMVMQGNLHVYRGGGICNYKVDTISGSLTINSIRIPKPDVD